MTYTSSSGWGPGDTPKTIYRLVAATSIISIFCALFGAFFSYFGIKTPQEFLSLSWNGLSNWHIWQPISYLFLQPGGNSGITFGFLISLFFNMYILWIMGSSTLNRVGKEPFLRFYFICGALTGLATLLFMPLIGQYALLAGTGPVILAILMVWTMLHPDSQILLFFFIPVQAKHLLPALLVLLLLINLSQLNFIELIFNFFGLFFGYLYATLVWGLESPYAFTKYPDKWLTDIGVKISNMSSWFGKGRPLPDKKAEIIDFHTGKAVMDDDLFMDAILEKISKFGEKSLTWSERNRMKQISKNKSRKQ
ncbi:MAG: rhomboid family intramembrane serine protease [Parachlamydiaceae bacterium]|nr:rhomboid family intramembrane serine protease [Parachlamydiaceae bacterium]